MTKKISSFRTLSVEDCREISRQFKTKISVGVRFGVEEVTTVFAVPPQLFSQQAGSSEHQVDGPSIKGNTFS
nr:hypothetical protein [uncultured Tolumonas sp.]